jgi:hypothetical protein
MLQGVNSSCSTCDTCRVTLVNNQISHVRKMRMGLWLGQTSSSVTQIFVTGKQVMLMTVKHLKWWPQQPLWTLISCGRLQQSSVMKMKYVNKTNNHWNSVSADRYKYTPYACAVGSLECCYVYCKRKFTIRKCKHMYTYPSSTYMHTANMTLSEILLKVALNTITPNPNGEYIS